MKCSCPSLCRLGLIRRRLIAFYLGVCLNAHKSPLLMLFVWLMFRLKVVCSFVRAEEVRHMLVKMGFDSTVEE